MDHFYSLEKQQSCFHWEANKPEEEATACQHVLVWLSRQLLSIWDIERH